MVNKVYFSLSQLGSNVVTTQSLELKRKICHPDRPAAKHCPCMEPMLFWMN